jgi:hypothetical protein
MEILPHTNFVLNAKMSLVVSQIFKVALYQNV